GRSLSSACRDPGNSRHSSAAALVYNIQHDDERSLTEAYVPYTSRARNADYLSPSHSTAVQSNFPAHIHTNPSAGYINARSSQASNLSTFVKPSQPDWLVRPNVSIQALEFSLHRLHRRAGLSAGSRKRFGDCVTLERRPRRSSR